MDTVSMLPGEGANIITHLTFDRKYVAQQRKMREEKKQNIDGFVGGAAEAAKSVGEGVVGIFDIFTKPIEGAQQDGVSGFFQGVRK